MCRMRRQPHRVPSGGNILAAKPIGLTQLLPYQDLEFRNVNAVNMFWTVDEGRVLADSLNLRNATTADWVWDDDGVQTGRSTGSTQMSKGPDTLVMPCLNIPTKPSSLNTTLPILTPSLSLDDEWITTLKQVLPTMPD